MAPQLTPADFQSEVLDSDKPVLVDFFGDHCGGCAMIAPLIDQLAGEVRDRAKVFKMNAVEAREISKSYGLRSVPTLLFFHQGEVKDQVIGAGISKDQLAARLLALA